LSSTTTKKVILERFEREALRGFANPQTCVQEHGIELMSPDGSVALAPYAHIKTLSFVRDLEGEGACGGRQQFLTRPKPVGLWVELEFRDGTSMEAHLGNNLMQIEGLGFWLTPPDAAGNTQRFFVPRAALKEVKALGVIGSPLRSRKPAKPVPAEQIKLFGEE
jgi:hypothetical protein